MTTHTMSNSGVPHLWEIDHPYYGADGWTVECETFDELRATVDALDEDMNHVYRWDWVDYEQPHHDMLFGPGEDRSKQTFVVFIVQPRKSAYGEFSCPIAHEDEPDVLAWLRGPRVLGAMRTLWAPLLDELS